MMIFSWIKEAEKLQIIALKQLKLGVISEKEFRLINYSILSKLHTFRIDEVACEKYNFSISQPIKDINILDLVNFMLPVN
jgi:hypothetical protein